MRAAERRTWHRTLCWLVLPMAGAALAQDDARPSAGREKARLTLGLLGTWPGTATRQHFTLGPFDLSPGEKLPPTLFAVGGGSDGCKSSMTVRTAPETVLETHAMVWAADVEVLSVSTDRIELGTTWQRLARGEHGQPTTLAGDEAATLTLEEGERVLLDFVRSPRPQDPLCAQSFALELRAELAEDPALAGRRIGYELWLVHEAAGSQRTHDYLGLAAMQGEQVAFAFPHHTVPTSPGRSAEELVKALQIHVSGGVRGRRHPDGSLELAVDTQRELWHVKADGGIGTKVGHFGEKLLNVQPGEAIRVELPDLPRDSERYARDLAGHSFALILRARPLP